MAFYGCAEPKNLILILTFVLTGYLGGILIVHEQSRKTACAQGRKTACDQKNKDAREQKSRDTWEQGKRMDAQQRKSGRWCLAVSAAVLLSFLGYFKYADFLLENLNRLTGLSIPMLRVVLPVGISFYTFQIISYLADVYRGDVACQRNFIDFGAYVMFFPQLIAGPIVRYRDIAGELEKRTHQIKAVYDGVTRFLLGLGKKILIANAMAQLVDIFRASDQKSVLFYWIYAAAFTLFIYFDFSGYSDMAIGLGRIMGFHFPENFNYPYLSGSITEFWRRWHMTLGGWFRDYVYIPLGGNRVKKSRWLFHIFIVWMLTGLWHGAAWNFVIWGLLFAVLLIIEKLTGFTEKIPKAFRHVYVLLVLVFSFVIFNAADMAQAGSDIRGLFGFGNLPLYTAETMYYLKSYLLTLIAAGIGCTPFPKYVFAAMQRRSPGVFSLVKMVGLVMILLLSTAYLVDGSFNPFLYFRF
ncbi:MAG: MBOAT family O-acyltransferase [Lachnospiraceae bacterium]|nr:MBOAT family O-acyltransferase [Lachnospiraceae bacterium]